jgi:small subunit ribosomal protein S20
LANSKQAAKRARQAEGHRALNTSQRSALRTRVKRAVKAIASGNRDEAVAAYQAAVPILDRMARKGIVHRNKAARHKSRLNARLRALG